MTQFERLVYRLRKAEKKHGESGSMNEWNEIKKLRKQIDDHLDDRINLLFQFGDDNENKREN